VRLHRDRLDEARNRLNATRENLERVQLLVREIEPRLRQLERQAGRAETYARLSAELTQTLRELYGRQWQEAQEAVTAARATLDQRQEQFDARSATGKRLRRAGATAGAVERALHRGREESFRQLQDYLRTGWRHAGTKNEHARRGATSWRGDRIGAVDRASLDDDRTARRAREDDRGAAGRSARRRAAVAELMRSIRDRARCARRSRRLSTGPARRRCS
jgi:chromosome segregation protein